MSRTFRHLSPDTAEKYLGSSSIFLAAAFSRKFGIKIEAAIEKSSDQSGICHAWAFDPISRKVYDIDGEYNATLLPWASNPHYDVLKGLTEGEMLDLHARVSAEPVSRPEWDRHVSEALALINSSFGASF